jgi:hypothetical protein
MYVDASNNVQIISPLTLILVHMCYESTCTLKGAPLGNNFKYLIVSRVSHLEPSKEKMQITWTFIASIEV